ncbi:MAG: HAMP domain-containing sensor histidine kinase [Actinomycetota bacterium]
MTIKGRIALVSAAAVAVAIVLISAGAFIGTRNQVMRQIDAGLIGRAAVIQELRPAALLAVLGIDRPDIPPDRIVPPRPGDFDASYYQVIFPSGSVINVGDDEVVLPEPDPEDLDPQEVTLRSEWVDDLHLRIGTLVRPDGRAVVQIARPLAEADVVLGRLAVLLLMGGVLGVALAAGLGLLVARSAVKPINDLASSVGSIAENREFEKRVDVVGVGEVADLAGEFNLLLDELESANDEQTRLVRDAGHELRTPLTALRTNLEVLQRHEVDPETRASMLAAANAEVAELAALVAEVVDLATDRYEEETIEVFDLADVATEVADRFGSRRNRVVRVESSSSRILGKRNAIERALSNIVGNADKFSSPDAPIEIDVSEGVVTVRDSGSGIDKHDLPHVFERFYRSDTARSRPGSGLGLSIVKQIVEDHDGEVFARNRPEGGASIGFSLDLAPNDDR